MRQLSIAIFIFASSLSYAQAQFNQTCMTLPPGLHNGPADSQCDQSAPFAVLAFDPNSGQQEILRIAGKKACFATKEEAFTFVDLCNSLK